MDSRIMVHLSIPNSETQRRLVDAGFVFLVGTYRLEDFRPDQVCALLPEGWRLEAGSVANLIFDEDQQPRFLDFMPSSRTYKLSIVPVEIPPVIRKRMARSKDGKIVTSGIPMDQVWALPHFALAIHNNRNFAAAIFADPANEAFVN